MRPSEAIAPPTTTRVSTTRAGKIITAEHAEVYSGRSFTPITSAVSAVSAVNCRKNQRIATVPDTSLAEAQPRS